MTAAGKCALTSLNVHQIQLKVNRFSRQSNEIVRPLRAPYKFSKPETKSIFNMPKKEKKRKTKRKSRRAKGKNFVTLEKFHSNSKKTKRNSHAIPTSRSV